MACIIWMSVVAASLDEDRTKSDPRALNAKLKAEVDQLDLQWARHCDADLDAVLAKVRAGDLSAELSEWKCHVEARSPDEKRCLVPDHYSIVDFRNTRRWQSWLTANMMVNDEKERIRAGLRERENQARFAKQEAQRKAAEAAENARLAKVSRPWPLAATAGIDSITLGTRINDGQDLTVPLRRMQHMLVVGSTGAGKSVFVQQIIYQLLYRSADVEQVIIFDLKGGVEFYRYRDNSRTRLVWEFSEVAKVMEALTALMAEREAYMREHGLQNWPGKRVFLIIDEYAEIQSEIDSASTKEEKAIARAVAVSLVRLGRRARALGIVLVCALQKATTDAMDSALRANLNCRICLRVNSRQFAASVLDGLDDWPADPTALPPGRFIYFDASHDELQYAVTQIAPGVTLGSS